jgi:hypothetical protein
MLEIVLVVGAVKRWVYLAAKPSRVGADVDGLSCPLHHPSTCGRQRRGKHILAGVALYHQAVVGNGALPRDVNPPVLDIWWSVDRLGTYSPVL